MSTGRNESRRERCYNVHQSEDRKRSKYAPPLPPETIVGATIMTQTARGAEMD